MNYSTKYIGLDVPKSKIAVAIADEGRQEPRYWGVIPHTKEAVRKLVQQLRKTSSWKCAMKPDPRDMDCIDGC